MTLLSAERLREAATLLRERAASAGEYPCPEWTQQAVRHIARNCDIECNHNTYDETSESWVEHACPVPDSGWNRYETGPFIAMMSPPVALALAEWLTDLANWFEYGNTTRGDIGHGYAIADAILGDQS